jgi:hypothetical protein
MNLMRNRSPKTLAGWKVFAKNLLIALGADIVLSVVLLFFLRRATDDDSADLLLVVEWWLLLAFFVANVCLAVATVYVRRKLYLILMINSILSGGIFHLLFALSLNR